MTPAAATPIAFSAAPAVEKNANDVQYRRWRRHHRHYDGYYYAPPPPAYFYYGPPRYYYRW